LTGISESSIEIKNEKDRSPLFSGVYISDLLDYIQDALITPFLLYAGKIHLCAFFYKKKAKKSTGRR